MVRQSRPLTILLLFSVTAGFGIRDTVYGSEDETNYAGPLREKLEDDVLPNPCAGRPCYNGATCIKTNGNAFDCICTERFTGIFCEKERDPCGSSPCKNGGTCTKVTFNVFNCSCAEGYTGPSCAQDINECRTGNGGCQDVCVNTVGGFNCACSNLGYRLAPDKRHCIGPNPCESRPCKNGGTCVKVKSHVFNCTCAQGYTGPNCAHDVDECKLNNGDCQDICVNSVGGYYCACSDSQFSISPDKRHCVAEGVDLDCGQNNMTITLPKSLLLGLDREHLRLIDVNCKASENLTHFFLTTELTACKTILRHKGDYTIYSNMVSEIPLKQNQVITRVRNAMVPFYCFYSKWGVVSSIGIKPMSKKVVLSSRGFGKFTITLDLFKKKDFENQFSQQDFPVQFTIRKRMYFQVRVDTEDDRLTILALDCFATPSQERNSEPRYDVIMDGCSADETLSFHPRPDTHTQRFSLEAFKYVSKHPYVFFHCKVKVCNAIDSASRCEQGCIERKRRSTKTLHDNIDDVYDLAQGPLTLKRENWETEEDDQDLDSNKGTQVLEKSINVSVITALAVLIGVCTLGLAYMAWQKKRGKTASQYKPI